MSEEIQTNVSEETEKTELIEEQQETIEETNKDEDKNTVFAESETTEETKTAEDINYQAKYVEAQKHAEKQNQAFQYLSNLAQEGNLSEIGKMLGVQLQAPRSDSTETNSLQELVKELSLSDGGADRFTSAVQSAISPILEKKDKEISEYKKSLNYLMQMEGNRQVENLRKDIPGFKDYEEKTGEIMHKYPGLSVKDAHILASHKDREEEIKRQAIENYKKSVSAKDASSNVFQPGDISKTSENPPAFKDFAEAYEYTKNKMVN